MGVLNDYQEWVADAWTKSPKENVSERDELLFLMEEVGEMAEAVRKMSGNKDNKDFQADLEKEFGDILLTLITLANRYGVDLEKAFLKTRKSIEKRYIKE